MSAAAKMLAVAPLASMSPSCAKQRPPRGDAEPTKVSSTTLCGSSHIRPLGGLPTALAPSHSVRSCEISTGPQL